MAAVALSLGCGNGGGDATVTGTITYNGAAPASGVIGFVQSGAPPKIATIQPGGAYQAKLPPGQYQVRIDAPPPLPEGWQEGQPIPQSGPRVVPEKYANFTTSGLTATISAEPQQQVDFKLP
ncbi:MAG: hypothetical protein DCC67_08750 [Planctomycetota bacterium]|nr:MAG: hypothetical protein DCC67_08750 [Planctomycetota bacterium]